MTDKKTETNNGKDSAVAAKKVDGGKDTTGKATPEDKAAQGKQDKEVKKPTTFSKESQHKKTSGADEDPNRKGLSGSRQKSTPTPSAPTHHVSEHIVSWAALVLAAGAMVILALFPYWGKPSQPDSTPQSIVNKKHIVTLEQRLTSLETELAALQEMRPLIRKNQEMLRDLQNNGANATLKDDSGAGVNVEVLRERIDGLTARLRAVENRASKDRRIAAVGGGSQSQGAALIAATGQLEILIQAGDPYKMALDSVRVLAADIPDTAQSIAVLDTYAARGVATRTELARRFAWLAARPRLTMRRPPDGGQWIQSTLENMRNVVSVRRTGGTDDLPPISIAEAALQRDDLQEAVNALAPLERNAGGDDTVLADWLRDARARLAVEKAVNDLRTLAIGRLSPSKNG